jgi:hypothetical protein
MKFTVQSTPIQLDGRHFMHANSHFPPHRAALRLTMRAPRSALWMLGFSQGNEACPGLAQKRWGG